MKKTLLSLITITFFLCEASFTGGGMAFAGNAVGDTFTSGNYTYKIKTAAASSTSPGTVSVKLVSGKTPLSISIPAQAQQPVSGTTYKYNVVEIESNAFLNCTTATSVTIGANVTTINSTAFSGCTNIEKVTWNATNYSSSIGITGGFQSSKTTITSFIFGNDVTRIPAYLCYNFSNLKSVVIPANVGTIGNYAFSGCSKLTEVLVKPTTVPTLGTSSFPSCANIYVEDEDLYKSSWTSYASKITSTVEGSCGTNATWSLNLATGVMTIGGTGAMDDYSSSPYGPWYTNYRPYIASVVVEDGITRIGSYAFYSCLAALTSVTIPTSVTSIGARAFHDCNKLNLGGAFYAGNENQWCGITFDDESANPIYQARKLYVNNDQLLTNAFISAATINAYAFTNDEALESVEFTYAVKTVGNSAFNSCTNISSVNYTSTINNWCGISFGNYNSNPASKSHGLKLNGTLQTSISPTTNIGAYAFYGNTALTSVTFSYNVKSIGSDAFNGCTNIGTVNYTSSVDNWCAISFANFSSNPVYYSHSLYLSNNLLTSAKISAKSIGQYAFNKNTSLTSVNLTKAVTIGNSAFASTGLTGELLLPNSLTEIGTNGFDGCASLSSITFASEQAGLTTIGGYAFRNCSTLVSVMIPQNVTTIGTTAFSGCSSLASIIACPSAVPTTGSSALYNVPTSIPVYVPSSSAKTAYQAATYWKNFTNYQIMTTYSGTCGTNLNWSLNIQTKELTISGEGRVMTDYDNSSNKAPWRTYSSSVKYLTIPSVLQHIGNWAFGNCTALERMTQIGSNVSYNASIGNSAFRGCSNLKGQITINAGVQTIGEYAFHSCSSVTDFNVTHFTASNETYPNQNQLTTIGQNAFTSCSAATFTGLWNSTYSANLTTIGNAAFMYCSTPTSLTIPNSVTTIGDYAFYGWNISSITIPAAVTSVGKSAFAGNASLRTVTWKAITCANFSGTDYEHPFYVSSDDKFQITSFSFDNAVTTLPSYICRDMDNITSITLPTSLTAIPAYAFKGCSALTRVGATNKTITIPAGITSIGGNAFNGCALIEHINLAAATSLTSIGTSAFNGLIAVSGELHIPSSVTSIGSSAFDGISGITSITADPLSPPTAYSSSFDDFDKSIPVYLQTSANPVSYANATGWKDFYNMSMTGYCGAEDGGHNLTWTYTPINSTLTISGSGAMADYANITAMPWNSFKTSITALVIGEGVTTIGNYAFHGCNNESFTTITIPESVTNIGTSAFSSCTHVETINYNAANIGDYSTHANSGNSGSTAGDMFNSCGTAGSGITLTFGAAVQHIPNYIFYPGDAYGHIQTGANIVSIRFDENAICSSIGSNAFKGINSLQSIQLPETLETIGNAAFGECNNINTITSQATTPPTLSSGFPSASGIVLYLPHSISAKTAYRGANYWSSFTEANTFPKIVQFSLSGKTGEAIDPQYFDNLTSKASAPSDPADDGYFVFDKWCSDEEGESPFNFASMNITADMTLFAKWGLNDLVLNEGVDNSDALEAYNGLTTDVSMIRSLTNAQYNTFCLPFSLDASQMATAFGAGYDLEELTDVTYDGEVLGLVFTQREALEAGKPYLLQPANNVSNPSFTGVEIDASTPSDGLDNTFIEFHGIYSPTELTGGNKNLLFLGAGNELFWPSSTGDLKGFRAYFEVKGSAQKAVRARIVKKEDAATGIDQITNDQLPITNKFLRSGQLFIIREGKTYNAQGALVK